MMTTNGQGNAEGTVLVLDGTGKAGRRLVERLTRRQIPVRVGSRSAGLPFDWAQPSIWEPVFQDVEATDLFAPDPRPAKTASGSVAPAAMDHR
jgi:uncharacterized protein YbjT (DUF2867 family)